MKPPRRLQVLPPLGHRVLNGLLELRYAVLQSAELDLQLAHRGRIGPGRAAAYGAAMLAGDVAAFAASERLFAHAAAAEAWSTVHE